MSIEVYCCNNIPLTLMALIMKAQLVIAFCLLFVFTKTSAQNDKQEIVKFDLDSSEWARADKVWREESTVVELLTRDSIIHRGQILYVTDTTLLFYEDSGMIDPARFTSLLHQFNMGEIESIYSVSRKKTLSGTAKAGIMGGEIGALLGVALYKFLPGKTFH